MRKKSASAMAEDAMLAAEIRKADYFTAAIRYGPRDKRVRAFADADPRIAYAEALAAAAEFDAESKFGRRAVVYAVNKLGTFDISPELAKLAGLA
jgi:hypothetical protein